jgi:hypothetical protein
MLGRDFRDIIKDAVNEAIFDATPPDGDINMVISEAVSPDYSSTVDNLRRL